MALFDVNTNWITDQDTNQLNDSLFGEPHPLKSSSLKKNKAKRTETEIKLRKKEKRRSTTENTSLKRKRQLDCETVKGSVNNDSPSVKRQKLNVDPTGKKLKKRLKAGKTKNKVGTGKRHSTGKIEETKMHNTQSEKGGVRSVGATREGKAKKTKITSKGQTTEEGNHTALNESSSETQKKKKKKKNNSKKNKYKHLVGVPKWNAETRAVQRKGPSSPPKKQTADQVTPTKSTVEPKKKDRTNKTKGKRPQNVVNTTKHSASPSQHKVPDSEELFLTLSEESEGNEMPLKKSNASKRKTKAKSPFSVEKLKSVLSKDNSSQKGSEIEDAREKTASPKDTTKKTKNVRLSLNEKMKEQLKAARFRYLNEQLYTQTGEDALQLFSEDQEAFEVYHEGFQCQVEKWPVNPVDRMISYIKKRPKSLIIADFGCGDAKIARNVMNEVHSFDLVALNNHVTVCDVADVPLQDESVDIGVFCLSLMGTNLVDFLEEANRVLKPGGTLLVAEVISRFEKVGSFVRKMGKLGFSLKEKDDTNKMFIWFEFKKAAKPSSSALPQIELSPCLYKRR